MAKTSTATLMTEGPIWRRLIAFAVPLFWGNLFQQLYNTADSLIVGNFLGNNALAAVSSSGNLIFLLVGFFNGISIGAGVVTGKYFGAGDQENLRKSIHTTILFGIACGILLTVVGIVAAPKILILMGTPQEVLSQSLDYFQVYFAGSLAFVIYNFFVGILQAMGDSRHPLYFVIISSLTKIALDLLFVGGLGLGVWAAAFATILSQFLSAFLCLFQLMKGNEVFRLRLRDVRGDWGMLWQIVVNGVPAGVQNSIISVANVFVQSNINAFGATAVAGCGSYSKIEGFGFLPVTCFALALTTFTSQNLGARKYERAKKGAVIGAVCSLCVAEFIALCINLFSPWLIGAFGGGQEAVSYGVAWARTVTWFYFLLAFSHCMAGILRGAGRSVVPMFVMMICWCVIRVGYISVIVRWIPNIRVIFWAYPLTWFLSSVVFLIYFLKSDWIHGLEKHRGKPVHTA